MTYLKLRSYVTSKYRPSLIEKATSLILMAVALGFTALMFGSPQTPLLLVLGLVCCALMLLLGWEARYLNVLPAIFLAWVSDTDDADKKAIIDAAIQSITALGTEAGK